MNWFETFFKTHLQNHTFLYNIDFYSEFLLFIAGACAVYLLVRRSLSARAFLWSAAAASIYWTVDPMPDFPLEGLVEGNYRLKFLSGSTIEYLLLGVLGFSVLGLSFVRKQRSLHRMAVGISLSVMISLMYGYHLVMINGVLKTNLSVVERYLDGANRMENIDSFCSQQMLACIEGETTIQTGIDEVDRHIFDYKAYASKPPMSPDSTLYFTASNALITAKQPFVFSYRSSPEGDRLILDMDAPLKMFDAARMQFYLFVNAAVMFWSLGALLLVVLHERMITRRRVKAG